MEGNAGKKRPKSDGVTVALINNGRLLLIKRRRFPFIANPGIWTFVQGRREGDESYVENAYREVMEEVKISKEQLLLIAKKNPVRLFDATRKGRSWENALLVFHCNTSAVKLNFENSAFRWANFSEVLKEKEYTNTFANKEEINDLIKRSIHAANRLEKQA